MVQKLKFGVVFIPAKNEEVYGVCFLQMKVKSAK